MQVLFPFPAAIKLPRISLLWQCINHTILNLLNSIMNWINQPAQWRNSQQQPSQGWILPDLCSSEPMMIRQIFSLRPRRTERKSNLGAHKCVSEVYHFVMMTKNSPGRSLNSFLRKVRFYRLPAWSQGFMQAFAEEYVEGLGPCLSLPCTCWVLSAKLAYILERSMLPSPNCSICISNVWEMHWHSILEANLIGRPV